MTYKVFVDDNFHYMDENERYTHGEFETAEAAIDACKEIVNNYLDSAYAPGMSAEDLYSSYTAFGEDPWISGPETNSFSAWDYANQRATAMCARSPIAAMNEAQPCEDVKPGVQALIMSWTQITDLVGERCVVLKAPVRESFPNKKGVHRPEMVCVVAVLPRPAQLGVFRIETRALLPLKGDPDAPEVPRSKPILLSNPHGSRLVSAANAVAEYRHWMRELKELSG